MPTPHPNYHPAPAPSPAPKSTKTTTPTPPGTTQVHHYTHCPHLSPPCTRPLNVQPTPSPSLADPSRSTLEGRCGPCDTTARRAAETTVLKTYAGKMKSLEMQRGVWDDDFLSEQKAASLKTRDEGVREVWKGYTRRWGIGCVGKEADGRMKLAWERPAKKKDK